VRVVSSKIITLEKHIEITPNFVPHPLYIDDSKLHEATEYLNKTSRRQDFLFFGSIKPYKGLDELLENWPVDIELKILGHCKSIQYTKRLLKIIDERSLHIIWENKFISTESLNESISNAKYVVLSHGDNAMIASGSFYHAISYGANIVCLPSKFGTLKSLQHPFVSEVGISELDSELRKLGYIKPNAVLKEALEFYGESVVRAAWKRALT